MRGQLLDLKLHDCMINSRNHIRHFAQIFDILLHLYCQSPDHSPPICSGGIGGFGFQRICLPFAGREPDDWGSRWWGEASHSEGEMQVQVPD